LIKSTVHDGFDQTVFRDLKPFLFKVITLNIFHQESNTAALQKAHGSLEYAHRGYHL